MICHIIYSLHRNEIIMMHGAWSRGWVVVMNSCGATRVHLLLPGTEHTIHDQFVINVQPNLLRAYFYDIICHNTKTAHDDTPSSIERKVCRLSIVFVANVE